LLHALTYAGFLAIAMVQIIHQCIQHPTVVQAPLHKVGDHQAVIVVLELDKDKLWVQVITQLQMQEEMVWLQSILLIIVLLSVQEVEMV